MKKLVILTGAGMSAESGISTFRDSNGLWENYRVEDVATPSSSAPNPTTATADWRPWNAILTSALSRKTWITFTNAPAARTSSTSTAN